MFASRWWRFVRIRFWNWLYFGHLFLHFFIKRYPWSVVSWHRILRDNFDIECVEKSHAAFSIVYVQMDAILYVDWYRKIQFCIFRLTIRHVTLILISNFKMLTFFWNGLHNSTLKICGNNHTPNRSGACWLLYLYIYSVNFCRRLSAKYRTENRRDSGAWWDVNVTRPVCKYYHVECEEFVRRVGRASRTSRVIYGRRMWSAYTRVNQTHAYVLMVSSGHEGTTGVKSRRVLDARVCAFTHLQPWRQNIPAKYTWGRNKNVTSGPGVRILHRLCVRV
jgi:hypothetical protein